MNPPVHSYQYVFDSRLHQLYLSLLVLGIFAVIIILLGFIGAPRFTGRNGRVHNKRMIASVVLFFLACGAAICFSNCRKVKRIAAHCGTTTGTITEKHWHSGKSHRWMYTYTYTANGQTYRNEDVYPSVSRHSDVAAATCYTVLYDTTDPGNAVMDLKEVRDCGGGW